MRFDDIEKLQYPLILLYGEGAVPFQESSFLYSPKQFMQDLL